jgi:SLT domain-containing protein
VAVDAARLRVVVETDYQNARRDLEGMAALVERMGADFERHGDRFAASSQRQSRSIGGIGRETERVGRDIEGFGRRSERSHNLIERSANRAGIQLATMGAKTAILSGPLISLGAAAFSVGAALAPLVGYAATLPAFLAAGGVAAVSAKLAFSGMGDALSAMDKAQDGSKASAEALKAAMDKLPPAARPVARQLFEMRGFLDRLRQTAAAGIMPGVAEALTRVRVLFPLVQQTIGQTSQAVGTLIRAAAQVGTSPLFRRDLATILSTNTTIINQLGHGTITLGRALIGTAAEARPLVVSLANLVGTGLRLAATWLDTQRASGNMARFFEMAQVRGGQLLRILGNMILVILRVGQASSGFGGDILEKLERFTAWLARSTANLDRLRAMISTTAAAFTVMKLALLGATFGPWGAVLGALAGALLVAYQRSATFRAIVAQVASFLTGTVWPAIQRFAGALGDMLGGAFGRAGSAAGGWQAVLARVMGFMSGTVMPIVRTVAAFIVERFNWAVAWFRERFPDIGKSGTNVMNALRAIIRAVLAAITLAWRSWGDDLFRLIKRVWDLIYGVFAAVFKIIGGVLDVFIGLFSGNWSRFGRGLLSIARGFWDLIVALLRGVFNIITTIGAAFMSVFGNLMRAGWNRVWDLIKSVGSGIANTVRDWTGRVMNTIRTWRDNIVTFISSLPGKFRDIGVRMFRDLISGLGSIDVIGWLKDKVGSAVDWVKRILKINSPSGVMYDIGRNMMLGVGNAIKDHAPDIFAPFISKIDPGLLGRVLGNLVNIPKNLINKLGGVWDKLFGGGQAVNMSGNLAAWARMAASITGVGASWVPAIIRRAMFESGGNPNAVNRWDINAKRGTPSMGVMQTIMPTFRAYALPGMGNILNPIHNMVAAIRYIQSRYGSIFAIDPPVRGYATGGWITEPVMGVGRSGQLYSFGERGRELVTPEGGVGGGSVYVASGGSLVAVSLTGTQAEPITRQDVTNSVRAGLRELGVVLRKGSGS